MEHGLFAMGLAIAMALDTLLVGAAIVAGGAGVLSWASRQHKRVPGLPHHPRSSSNGNGGHGARPAAHTNPSEPDRPSQPS